MMDQEFVKSIGNIHRQIVKQALSILEPEVERIINTKNKDVNVIEHALDALCELAFDAEVLLLFKRLCRYYYNIDPQATIEQIQFYRYLWEGGSLKKESGDLGDE